MVAKTGGAHKEATLNAIMETAIKHRAMIERHILLGIFETAVLELPLERKITLDPLIEKKLKLTVLKRNLTKGIYSHDLNELWIHLTDDEIGIFFRDILEQTRQARVIIADQQISYMSQSLFV
jgi:hypothetical protein